MGGPEKGVEVVGGGGGGLGLGGFSSAGFVMIGHVSRVMRV